MLFLEEGLSLGQRIATLRERRGASLQEVADAVGVSKAHIWQIEKGKADNPALGLIERLAGYFRVSVSELIGEDISNQSVDPVLAGLFREAQKFGEYDRQLLIEFMEILIRMRAQQKRKAIAKSLLSDDY
jgi:transcriptional regulator with XRE-family HTH domain